MVTEDIGLTEKDSLPIKETITDFSDPTLYINRELSWIDFNKRVLEQAFDDRKPILDRLRMLAISAGNLDEFYMIRVSGLQEQIAADINARAPDGLSPRTQLAAVNEACKPLHQRISYCFSEILCPLMQKHGFGVHSYEELDDNEKAFLRTHFREHFFPVLTPLAVDRAHPFPYISNQSLNLAVQTTDPKNNRELFARVKVPTMLPRFVQLPNKEETVPIEQVISANLDLLFPGMEVIDSHPFHILRDADLDISEEETEDLRLEIENHLRKRRFRSVIALCVNPSMPQHMRDLLIRELDLARSDLIEVDGLLRPADLNKLLRVDKPELDLPPWSPRTHPLLLAATRNEEDIFSLLRKQDIFVHHPYDSFSTSVEEFILSAVDDENVLAIKQTLYRTTENSRIMQGLIRAAEAGKQVVVVIEIKARFDEERNLEWARRLEAVGAHVVYGLMGLKTHSKAVLVVRKEKDGIRRYVHLGTGNYNATTARLYEDMGMLSSRPELGADLSDLFNLLTGYSRQRYFRKIHVAPYGLRDALEERIIREIEHVQAGRDALIRVKLNSVTDATLIRCLYRASCAGVKIQMIVRGICCLRPGIPNVSENITVRSIVGRFLEHSRVVHFHNDGADEYLIGSADWMSRNLDRRVETYVPIEDPNLVRKIDQMLHLYWTDNSQAWTLQPDGTWTKPEQHSDDEGAISSHKLFMQKTNLNI